MWQFKLWWPRPRITVQYLSHGIYLWLTPWLNLLEVYRSLGRQAEFETVALYLHDDFNCKLIRWHSQDGFCAGNDHQSLEEFPHIIQRLTDTWGQRECLSFLKSLLEDKRDKTRTGFHLAVFQEILLLAGLLEMRLEESEAQGANAAPGAGRG
ncbi:MAG: hypothetical protein PHU46_15200 [Rhodocyclaceae bacterium]|nr:hypothetical protein [Rhodocyclaceae bacterium]